MRARRLLTLAIGATVLVLCQSAHAASPGAAAAPNVMALEGKFPEMDVALKLVKNDEKDLAAYLRDPESVCTFFLPTGEALTSSLKRLGKYAGKAAQNATLARSTINYHVVPGKALTADQIGSTGTTRALTKANETVFFWREGGKPYVYFRRDLPVPLNRTNIKAGKCIVHTLDTALVPPTANSMVQPWLEELGTMPKTREKSRWAPEQKPLPGSLEAGGAQAADAALPAAVRSGARGCGSGQLCGSTIVCAAIAGLMLVAAAI